MAQLWDVRHRGHVYEFKYSLFSAVQLLPAACIVFDDCIFTDYFSRCLQRVVLDLLDDPECSSRLRCRAPVVDYFKPLIG